MSTAAPRHRRRRHRERHRPGPELQSDIAGPGDPHPQTRTNLSPRIDTQIGNNNTLTFRYQLWQNSETNPNVGQFTLPSAAYNSGERYQSFQVSDAQVINEKAVTEVRFRFCRDY